MNARRGLGRGPPGAPSHRGGRPEGRGAGRTERLLTGRSAGLPAPATPVRCCGIVAWRRREVRRLADLAVNTVVLHGAARELTAVSAAAHDIADSHVRAAQLAWACGRDEPAQAVDSFLNHWAYGIRWIASQAEQLGRDVSTTAMTFEVREAALARAAAGGDPVAIDPLMSARPATPVATPLPMVRHFAPAGSVPPMQLAQATRADQLIPGDPDQVALLARMVHEFADAAYDARRSLPAILAGWMDRRGGAGGGDGAGPAQRAADPRRGGLRRGRRRDRHLRAHACRRAGGGRAGGGAVAVRRTGRCDCAWRCGRSDAGRRAG